MGTYTTESGPVSIGTTGITKTILDLATSATTPATIVKWWVGSDAVSAGTATSAIRVQVGLFSAAVTTHSGSSIGAVDAAATTIAARTAAGLNTTVEGAGTATAQTEEYPLALTQSLFLVWDTVPLYVPISAFWRIRVIAPANIGATNIYAGVAWTE